MLHPRSQQRLLPVLGLPESIPGPVGAAGNVSLQYCVTSMCSSHRQTFCSWRRSSCRCCCNLSSAVVGTFASTAGAIPLSLLLIAAGHICWLGTCSAHSPLPRLLPGYFDERPGSTYSPCLLDCPLDLRRRTSCCLSFRIYSIEVYCCVSRRGWRSALVACRLGSWRDWVGYWHPGN